MFNILIQFLKNPYKILFNSNLKTNLTLLSIMGIFVITLTIIYTITNIIKEYRAYKTNSFKQNGDYLKMFEDASIRDVLLGSTIYFIIGFMISTMIIICGLMLGYLIINKLVQHNYAIIIVIAIAITLTFSPLMLKQKFTLFQKLLIGLFEPIQWCVSIIIIIWLSN